MTGGMPVKTLDSKIMVKLIDIFNKLERTDTAFRFECDDSGYHLTLIDRSVYPRCWIDNANSGQSIIIVETPENFLHRELPTMEKDWNKRYSDDTIEGLINLYNQDNG